MKVERSKNKGITLIVSHWGRFQMRQMSQKETSPMRHKTKEGVFICSN